MIATDPTADLFTERTLICRDCQRPFTTHNPRTRSACAECNAALRAKVICPGCDTEHQIAILAPHKFCPACASDMDATRARLRAELDAAEDAATAAYTRLDADYAHADEADRDRYQAAIDARRDGLWRGEVKPPAFFAAQWDAAIARNDGLSPLLRARVAWDAASATLERARGKGETT